MFWRRGSRWRRRSWCMRANVDAEGILEAPFSEYLRGFTGNLNSSNHLVLVNYPKASTSLCGAFVGPQSDFWGEPGEEGVMCERCGRVAKKRAKGNVVISTAGAVERRKGTSGR